MEVAELWNSGGSAGIQGLRPHNMRLPIREQLALLVLVTSLLALAVVAIATVSIAGGVKDTPFQVTDSSVLCSGSIITPL